jgi:hypothetical protein
MSLLDKASLIVTPNAVKESKLYSVVPSSGAGDMDVVRATTATRVNSAGLIESVAVNVPRIDYTNGSCPSLLVEPQRSNLLTYSEQFDDASWSKAAITVTANSVVSPSGVQNADTLTTSAYPSTSVGKNNTLSATNHTLSCYVKAGSVSTFRLDLVTAGFALGSNCIFNLSTVSTTITNYGTTTGSTATITSVGNGWYRCTLTVLTTAVVYFSQLYPAANGSVYAWGVQLEAGSYPTSYIPTVASSVTRNADVISKTGISSLIGQTEGTLFCDVNLDTRTNFTYLFLNDGAYSNYLGFVFRANSIEFEIVKADGLQCSIVLNNSSTGRFKLAVAYINNNFVFYVNGNLIGTDNSGIIPTSSKIELFYNTSNIIKYNSVQLYKTKLSNTELAQLTTL